MAKRSKTTDRNTQQELPTVTEGATGEEAAVATATTDEKKKQWSDPYQPQFTSVAKGFELAEDRRYGRLVFKFKAKPEPEVLAKLKEAKFRWDSENKVWTLPANAVNRVNATRLARELHGEEQLEGVGF